MEWKGKAIKQKKLKWITLTVREKKNNSYSKLLVLINKLSWISKI